MKAVHPLDPLVPYGCGLTVTEDKEFMSNLSDTDNIEIYNRSVKKLLLEYYGDRKHFCPVIGIMLNVLLFSYNCRGYSCKVG
jgi:hypothetical protein